MQIKNKSILLLLFLVPVIISAQEVDTTLSGKQKREQKKLAKEAKLQKQFDSTYQVLSKRSFVLEAEFIENTKVAGRQSVDKLLNFILVDSSNAVLQIGSDKRIGYNGVGGSTAKGKIKTYTLSKNDKKKSCSLFMLVDAMSGSYNVNLDVSASGNANAWVSLKFSQLHYEGKIVPLKQSKAYKGSTWYQ